MSKTYSIVMVLAMLTVLAGCSAKSSEAESEIELAVKAAQANQKAADEAASAKGTSDSGFNSADEAFKVAKKAAFISSLAVLNDPRLNQTNRASAAAGISAYLNSLGFACETLVSVRPSPDAKTSEITCNPPSSSAPARTYLVVLSTGQIDELDNADHS